MKSPAPGPGRCECLYDLCFPYLSARLCFVIVFIFVCYLACSQVMPCSVRDVVVRVFCCVVCLFFSSRMFACRVRCCVLVPLMICAFVG